MHKLNDYLYSGDTILKILHNYARDLKADGEQNGNKIDLFHSVFLTHIADILENHEFVMSQSERMHEFYMNMVRELPYLSFTFGGRIKSLIRSEQKFNGYLFEYMTNYYRENQRFPTDDEIRSSFSCFRDLIAYRIVISLPKCHVKPGESQHRQEINYLYKIAGQIPEFMLEHDFVPVDAGNDGQNYDNRMKESARPYFRDYIARPRPHGYRALHITLYDKIADCHIELQLRTKKMDDDAEIGPANHLGYRQRQKEAITVRSEIPVGENVVFDEAMERMMALHTLELKDLDVNMFRATNNQLINDRCGLFRGRMITPFEHLSRFETYD